jgi:hypothetical protein
MAESSGAAMLLHRGPMRETLACIAMAGLLGNLAGCASYAENQRLSLALERSRREVVVGQARLVDLESRVKDIEHGDVLRAERLRSDAAARLMDRIELLIVQNQELLRQREGDDAPAAELRDHCDEDRDPIAQLRDAVERLRSDPGRWRGGLSPAQNQVLTELLRRERSLDPRNPWDVR